MIYCHFHVSYDIQYIAYLMQGKDITEQECQVWLITNLQWHYPEGFAQKYNCLTI